MLFNWNLPSVIATQREYLQKSSALDALFEGFLLPSDLPFGLFPNFFVFITKSSLNTLSLLLFFRRVYDPGNISKLSFL